MHIIIIGAGPGGYETAVAARKKNFDVTLIAAGPVGGTCLNEGCIPTKCFCHDADLFRTLADNLPEQQTEALRSGVLEHMVSRKDEVVGQLREGVKSLLKGVELVQGIARVVDAHTVRVWPAEEESAAAASPDPEFSEYEEYRADRIIIATGSHPAWLNVPGAADTPGVLSSSDMLRLKEMPERLTVIGGGVIGLEFASIFSALGSKVTVIEYCRNILPHFDTDLAKRLKQSLAKRGIAFMTGTEVTGISSSVETSSDSSPAAEPGRQVQIVTCRCGENVSAVVSDKVLMAVGRAADTRVILGCEGIEHSRRGIKVDENMQTTLPGVYAVGDVNGRMMLAHAATFQGKVALEHICRGIGSPDGSAAVESGSAVRLDIMPAAVFTVPEAAAVGLTEDDCKEKGIAFKALKSFYRANGKALAAEAGEGYCKILVAQDGQPDLRDGQILGCHILGAGASDLISEVSALMNFNATAAELSRIIHPHPSLSEIIRNCV